MLRRLADETGGAYWKIGNATQLQEVYERIDHLETSEIKTTILYHTEIRPLFQYLALTAFVLLLRSEVLRATWLRVAEEVCDESRHALDVAVAAAGGVAVWLMARSPPAVRGGLPTERGDALRPEGISARRDWLVLAALVCVVVALARPQWNPRPYDSGPARS